jgi:hypothetical protein
LALACCYCNRYKGPDLSGIDPNSGEVVPLFHPRRQQWDEHDLKMRSVELSRDFYWSTSDEELYEVDRKPRDLAVGSLVDDFHFVAAAHKDPDQAIPVTLMHVAPLLKWLSRAVPSYVPPSEKNTP